MEQSKFTAVSLCPQNTKRARVVCVECARPAGDTRGVRRYLAASPWLRALGRGHLQQKTAKAAGADRGESLQSETNTARRRPVSSARKDRALSARRGFLTREQGLLEGRTPAPPAERARAAVHARRQQSCVGAP